MILGDKWKKMKNEERRMYTMEAKALAEEQKRLNPDCWKRKRTNSVSISELLIIVHFVNLFFKENSLGSLIIKQVKKVIATFLHLTNLLLSLDFTILAILSVNLVILFTIKTFLLRI